MQFNVIDDMRAKERLTQCNLGTLDLLIPIDSFFLGLHTSCCPCRLLTGALVVWFVFLGFLHGVFLVFILTFFKESEDRANS